QTQFMPDNYLKLGVDQNGDGKVDIWGSDADALASAANLLAQAGWKRGQGWAYEVTLPSNFDYAEAEGPKHPWAYWVARGVRLADGSSPNSAEAAEGAAILLPQGARGPAFLALPNHYVIRRYNNSVSYALAIGLTADGVQGKPGLVASWPDDAPLSREQRVGAQRALTALGYDTQGVDGVIGANTRAALRRWQQANGRLADGYLTAALADELIRRGGGGGPPTSRLLPVARRWGGGPSGAAGLGWWRGEAAPPDRRQPAPASLPLLRHHSGAAMTRASDRFEGTSNYS